MEGDGQSAVLTGRRSHSGLAAGLFPKCFGCLTHLYTEAGGEKKRITKNVTGLKGGFGAVPNIHEHRAAAGCRHSSSPFAFSFDSSFMHRGVKELKQNVLWSL